MCQARWDLFKTVSINYHAGAIVVYQDTMYVSLLDNNDNNEPGQSPTWWEALGESNVVHLWNERASYEIGSLVYRREDGLASNPALLYYAEVAIPAAAADPAPANLPPETGGARVPMLMEDGMPFDPPRTQAQWLAVGGGAARLTMREANGPFPVIKTVSDADPVTGVRTVSYEFTELQDADGNVIFGTAAINFREFREGLGLPSTALRVGDPAESSSAFTFRISENGNDFSDATLVADFTAAGGEENTLTRTDNGQQITLSYQLRDNQIDTNPAPFISVEATHVVDDAIFNSGDGIKMSVNGQNLSFRADVRENSTAFTNTLEINESGMFVAPYTLSALQSNTDVTSINIAGGAGVSSSINVLTNAIATTEAAVSSVTVDVTDDGDLRVSAPPVASWAQTQEGDTAVANSIIPASKLPNLELGNTHTFDSSSHGSSEPGVIRVANEFTSAAVADLLVTRSTEPDAEDVDSVLAFPATQAATPLTAFFAGQSDYLGGPATFYVEHHSGGNTTGVVEQPLTLTRFLSAGFAAVQGGVPITRITSGPDYAFGTRFGWTRAGGSNDNDVTIRADGPDAARLLADVVAVGLGRNPNGIFLDSAPFTTTPSAEQVAEQLAAGFQMALGFANFFERDTIPPFSFGVSGPVGTAANGNPYTDTMIQWAVVPQTDAVSVQILGTDAARAAQDLLDATRGAGGRVIINSATGETGFEAFGNFLDTALISGPEENHLVVANPAMLATTSLTRWYTGGVPTISPEISGEVQMTTASDGPLVRANPSHISSREIQTLYHGNREGFTDQTTAGLSTARTALSRTPYAQGTFIGWSFGTSRRTTILIWGQDADRVQADLVAFFTGPDSRTGSGLFLEPVPIDENDRSTYLVNSITQDRIGGITATAGRPFRDAQILSIGERTDISSRPYVDTTVSWTYNEETDRLTLLVEGTDAALAQMELDAAVAASIAPGGTPIGAIALSDAAATSRDLTNTFFVNGAGDLAITNARTYMPSSGAFEGELRHEVVQNDGEQRDGTDPIAWHPGDLLVLAGVSPDAGDNGIYVYVGVDQGTTPISPLPLPLNAAGDPQTYVDPLIPTDDEVDMAFGFNFRTVLNASTEIGTTANTFEINDQGERVTAPLGRLNQVNYSAGGDILELRGSTNNTPVQIPLAERIADDTMNVGGFINHIKIGGTIYRFGATPTPPLGSLNAPRLFGTGPEDTFRLYRATAQTLDYNIMGTQDLTNADGSIDRNHALVPSEINNEMFTITPSAEVVGTPTVDNAGMLTVPAGSPQTDDTATIALAASALFTDVNIPSVAYNSADMPSPLATGTDLTQTVRFADARAVPSISPSSALTTNVLDTTVTSTSVTVNGVPGRTTTAEHDIQVNAGNLYDVAGYIYGANGAPNPAGTLVNNGAAQVQAFDLAFAGDLSASTTPQIRRTMQFAFPMVDNPRNGQPDVDPGTLTRVVNFFRPWGWLSARPGITPDADAVISAIGRGSNHFTRGIGSTTVANTYAAGTYEATVLAPNVADIFWFAVPQMDIGTGTLMAITPSTDGDFGINPVPNATIAVPTVVGGVSIMYNLYSGAGASRTTSGTLIRVTATSS